jgi:argininosuccinate synthase
MTKKIVLSYSGGLDTSVMSLWLKDKYRCKVIACIVDVGQGENLNLIKKRALNSGASKVYVINAKEEFAKNYIFPALKANAVYEGKYLLGTAVARPLIAEKIISTAKKEGAFAVSHGATGKGNDQVRFELSFRALMPDVKIIAPWREWDLKSREDEIRYAKKHHIQLPPAKNRLYSEDANLWHISYEGELLENPELAPEEDIFQLTVSPEKAPGKPTYVKITFLHGIPIKINGKKYTPAKLIELLNRIGGKNAIGRIDMIENRVVGMKARNVYECPAATILYTAHRELESLTLDRETMRYKELIGPKYGELVYCGLWHSRLKKAMDAFIDETQKFVTGDIKLKLYKGNVNIASRRSPYSLYSKELSTFGVSKDVRKRFEYDHKDASGFLKLYGLSLEVESFLRKQK